MTDRASAAAGRNPRAAARRTKWLWPALCTIFALQAAWADSPVSPASAPNESLLVEHGHYVNKSGHIVHSPAHTKTGQAPSDATAQCRDGTYSFSEHHRGTCSHHGGVSGWITR
jgi:Protein of unknown function (DUF3761)